MNHLLHAFVENCRLPHRNRADTAVWHSVTVGRVLCITATLLAFVAMFALAGCAGGGTGLPKGAEACNVASKNSDDYQIGAGDVLHIAVWNNKQLDREVTVRPDGMISFPLVNDVRAAGRTPMQLQSAMTKDLKRYMSDPELSVVVKQVHSFTVSVIGEVQHPGRYEMDSDHATVLDALADAGGFTDYASRSDIGVLRSGAAGKTRIHFQYQKAISSNPGEADFCVRPGDIVVVP